MFHQQKDWLIRYIPGNTRLGHKHCSKQRAGISHDAQEAEWLTSVQVTGQSLAAFLLSSNLLWLDLIQPSLPPARIGAEFSGLPPEVDLARATAQGPLHFKFDVAASEVGSRCHATEQARIAVTDGLARYRPADLSLVLFKLAIMIVAVVGPSPSTLAFFGPRGSAIGHRRSARSSPGATKKGSRNHRYPLSPPGLLPLRSATPASCAGYWQLTPAPMHIRQPPAGR
ncbi:hypothetical protein QBC43DRAFT_106356 [Cladorrhinum sp. PSN259]|nr:hypothetical protein QBC43DRAFT_106356 [Cladorrhinum sp. PSN259]